MAFPITILSINTGELYNKYRTEKMVEEDEKEKGFKPVSKSNSLTLEQIEIIKEMSQDLIKSIEYLNKLKDAATAISDQNSNIRISVMAILGDARTKTRQTAVLQ